MEIQQANRLNIILIVTVFGVSPQVMSAEALRLTLVVYDRAQIQPETLDASERTTAEIFKDARIQLVWRQGFAYAAERRNAVSPAAEEPATLVVTLQPASEAARFGVRSVCGGVAIGSNISIFVRHFAANWLGPIMAHEIGHVVLGPNAHAIAGIMRATLLADEWEKAAQGTLGFTHSQKQKIRAWISQDNR
jgi:hypothetical protein